MLPPLKVMATTLTNPSPPKAHEQGLRLCSLRTTRSMPQAMPQAARRVPREAGPQAGDPETALPQPPPHAQGPTTHLPDLSAPVIKVVLSLTEEALEQKGP